MMMQTANRVLTFYLMLDDEDEVDEGNKIDSCMVSLAGIPEYMYA